MEWYAFYMKDESFEMRPDIQHQTGEAYNKYQELGGIINEKDCKSALTRAERTAEFGQSLLGQAENIAKHAGIVLDNSDGVDTRVKLYAVLRADNKPENVKYHHSQMSDQRLFAEVLRMLGDTDALNKLVDAYHKVGTYCPICLKVIESDEECR